MPITLKQSNSEAEYQDLVERFSYFTDLELKKCEGFIEKGDIRSAIYQVPSLICLVNSIGYFRGQDGVFLDSRPNVANIQNDLRANEDAFESRLRSVIAKIKASSEVENYKSLLETNFIKYRT